MKLIAKKIYKFVLSKIVFRINPKWYYGVQYFRFRRRLPNFKKPSDLSEYLLAEQLKPEFKRFAQYADKIKVRDYVVGKGFADILPKVYQIVKDANQIDFDALPDRFVLKTNHGCGSHVICRNKSLLNKNEAIASLNRTVKTVYSITEPHYKYIEPVIYAEEFIDDKRGQVPVDYKFMVSRGEVINLLVCSERDTGVKFSVYDTNWNNVNDSVYKQYLSMKDIAKPKNLNRMINIAQTLGADFDFVRVDLYDTEQAVFFSELTFTPAGGYIGYYTNSLLKGMYKSIAKNLQK